MSDARTVSTDQVRRAGAPVNGVFGTLPGYAGIFRQQDLEAVRPDSRTRLVVKDEAVKAIEVGEVEQAAAPYGVDRVDRALLPLDRKIAAHHDGEGVTVYVTDSGIRAGHQEFGGRTSVGSDFVGVDRIGVDRIGVDRIGVDCIGVDRIGVDRIGVDRIGVDCIGVDCNGVDCNGVERNGQGVHVAGIVGDRTYEVAKGVKIVGVRARNRLASGKLTDVLADFNWVVESHAPNSVANPSLGGCGNRALDLAVTAGAGKGVHFDPAAGNGNLLRGTNARNVPTARVSTSGVMTVTASDAKDVRASISNYGPCADRLFPGKSVKSAWRTSNTATPPASLGTALPELSQKSAVVNDSRTAAEHGPAVDTGGAAGL